MSNDQEALDYMRANNETGIYDQVLKDYAEGKINVGIMRNPGPSLDLLKSQNVLGRYDKIIEQVQRLIENPVIYFTPRAT
jgi:hypothetical protein